MPRATYANCTSSTARTRREAHRARAEPRGSGCRAAADAAREAIEQLVEAVHGHARTLALLAPALRSRGVEATRTTLVDLMAEMDRKFPGSREKSVFASVELSLRRLSPANRDKVRVLGVFHGGVDLDVLRTMMQWEEADVASLAGELIETRLATPNRYNHHTLNPALCPYLQRQTDAAECEALTARWGEAMRGYAWLLVQQQGQNSEIAATLTVLELPNLVATSYRFRSFLQLACAKLLNAIYEQDFRYEREDPEPNREDERHGNTYAIG